MRKFKGMMKAAVALILAGSMVFGSSIPAQARAYCDGNTPDDIENRVVGTDGVEIQPSIRTTFLTPQIGTLCPITPYMDFDKETGRDKSVYTDARSEMHILPAELNDMRIEMLTAAETGLGVTRIGFTSMYLSLYEGKCYKPVISTEKLMQFRIGIDKSFVNKDREFILIGLDWNGEATYYLDIDDDIKTMTFATNDFSGYNLYVLEYAPKGSFLTLEAEINQGLKKGVTKQTVINEAIAELLKAQQ